MKSSTSRQPITRHTSGPLIGRFTGAIQRGEWTLNGESIKFDTDGHLIDGQHRLRAVLAAGQPITTIVVRGLPSDARETVDIGHSRNLADLIAMRGERWNTVLAAALYQLSGYRRNGTFGLGGQISTPQQMLHLLEAEPSLRDWLPRGRSHPEETPCPQGHASRDAVLHGCHRP